MFSLKEKRSKATISLLLVVVVVIVVVYVVVCRNPWCARQTLWPWVDEKGKRKRKT